MIQSAPFGHAPDGTPLSLFTLTNAQGMEVRITNYGGIVTHILHRTAMAGWPTSRWASIRRPSILAARLISAR